MNFVRRLSVCAQPPTAPLIPNISQLLSFFSIFGIHNNRPKSSNWICRVV